ncbi:hypothetical protein Sxan_54890 [Streptomyces xanthophaeus]|uniref:Uncharacterized protein n=1 Tax=Streptomyces xanthophaeus TaxID=67385 RepID=A0A919H1K1_9ACTN|nr:hypothetical protein Sxan_54890 [Streptomyces xanthophaeus]
MEDDQFQRGDLVEGYALDAGQDHRGHRLRLDLGEEAAHAELVAGRIVTGTRAAVAPSGAPKYLYVTPMPRPLGASSSG